MTTAARIKIILAIGNNVLAEGLRRILSESEELWVCAPENRADHCFPDLILFDIQQPISQLRQRYPRAKPVLLDSGCDPQSINFLLMYHQLRGVIAPQETIELFYKALQVVHEGDVWIDQAHLKALLQDETILALNKGEIKGLNEQDRRIIDLIADGAKNRQIAEHMCLSEHTIKSHVSRIYRKLKVKNRAQLVSLAQRSNLQQRNNIEPLPSHGKK
jgi:DNA-binding NarL/FixJ family response regulator